ncbi:MAG TPA: 4Fe-4S binding protein [Bacteroidales bacterium]|nr:4Fe-4S binding protein [Bacteroidales bacterium]HSA43803.1 4Fe-4S binding protein [Bacteroidales bacterium]
MGKRKKKWNYYRVTFQWIILLLLGYMVVRAWVDPAYFADFEAYCPIGGMQAYSSFLVNNSLACSMTTLQIAMGFALIAGVILFAKLFCSFICPVGTFTEWLGRLGEKWKIRYTITGWADRLLRLLKYALLFITFYFTINSSELFCKQYDPFYAIFTGFGSDVVIWMALLALAVTILGSLFVRQFWCKYLCPLGAATNLFAFTVVFIVITAIYALLIWAFGLSIGWIWYLGALCLAGFLVEAFKQHTCFFPLVKITRHDELCTHCKICDKVCPYNLNISEADKVTHIDCHLCGDCVVKCPEAGALKYNGRKLNWLPPAAIIVLVVAGILISANNQVPTIDQQWGSPEQMKNASIYTQSGLKNVKCFGSSMAFANHIKDVPGILGVQTYVKTKTVKIYFDPSVITTDGIKEAMFTPVKEIIALPGEDVNQIFFLNTGIDHFFDPNDAALLAEIFGSREGIYGFETHYGEPVETTIFYDENKIRPAEIKALIETKEFGIKDGDQTTMVKPGFAVAWVKDSHLASSRQEFLQGLFEPYDRTFNDYETCDSASLATLRIPFPEALEPAKKTMIGFLRNHLMNDKGTVRFSTRWEENNPFLYIYYLPEKTTPENIMLSLKKPKLHITYKSGETEDIDNPFMFPGSATGLIPN